MIAKRVSIISLTQVTLPLLSTCNQHPSTLFPTINDNYPRLLGE
jgi:hypothetical protein